MPVSLQKPKLKVDVGALAPDTASQELSCPRRSTAVSSVLQIGKNSTPCGVRYSVQNVRQSFATGLQCTF